MTGRLLWMLPLVLVALAAVFPYQRREALTRSVSGRTPADTLAGEIGRHPEFALGFRNFLGDIVWLKAVQVAGARNLVRQDYDDLAALVDTTVNLDPRFVVPYFLGSLILGDSSRHAVPALRILEKGRANHPSDWRFPFYIGYVHYFSLGSPSAGGNALRDASLLPDSPPYLPFLATRMLAEGREPETALLFLSGMLRQERDPARRTVLESRLREVVVERDIQALEHAVSVFRDRTGGFPGSLGDLAGAGILARLPVEPNGGRYVLGADGSVRSDRVTLRLRVFRKGR